mmetsp:Transcript_32082/g.38295  ORF Transcript_32082/g.38295 Transcript_32082/m.38295 type:complete len:115 (+) Transcript_32082:13-357(+)
MTPSALGMHSQSSPTVEPTNPPITLAIPYYPTSYSRAVIMESDIAWNPKQVMYLITASSDNCIPVSKLWYINSLKSIAEIPNEDWFPDAIPTYFCEGGLSPSHQSSRISEGGSC